MTNYSIILFEQEIRCLFFVLFLYTSTYSEVSVKEVFVALDQVEHLLADVAVTVVNDG